MLMDESPTPSPPRPRPDTSTTPPKASIPSNHATISATGAQKQSEKRRTTSVTSHSNNKSPEVPKTTRQPRSKSVSQRPTTHSLASSKLPSSPTPKTGEGVSGSKKKGGSLASGSGGSLRPNTSLNGGRSSTNDESKRKLLSAKR